MRKIPLVRRTGSKFIHKMFEKVEIKRDRRLIRGGRSENVDYNENSEGEEEFQEGFPLMRQTQGI